MPEEAGLDGDGIAGIDLRPLEGENALEIWSGELTAGEYNKVLIYVDNVTGVLEGGRTADVKLPGNKLQISNNPKDRVPRALPVGECIGGDMD